MTKNMERGEIFVVIAIAIYINFCKSLGFNSGNGNGKGRICLGCKSNSNRENIHTFFNLNLIVN